MTCPNVFDPNVVIGGANSGVLKTLRASARNCAWNRSLMEMSLNSDMSQFACPGLRHEMSRDKLPNVYAGASENAAGFRYELSRDSGLPE